VQYEINVEIEKQHYYYSIRLCAPTRSYRWLCIMLYWSLIHFFFLPKLELTLFTEALVIHHFLHYIFFPYFSNPIVCYVGNVKLETCKLITMMH